MKQFPLFDQIPLLPKWNPPELFEKSVQVGDQPLHLVGILSKKDETSVALGSSGELHSPNYDRACYELLERMAIFEAIHDTGRNFTVYDSNLQRGKPLCSQSVFDDSLSNSHQKKAKSNGVALARSLEEAAQKAQWELLERDALLRSWYGLTQPVLVTEKFQSHLEQIKALGYEIVVAQFESSKPPVYVIAVFGFSNQDSHPTCFGFGSHMSEQEAFHKALSEYWQRLGFLWGEEILLRKDIPFHATAEFHQEYYLSKNYADEIKDWISGKHFRGNLQLNLNRMNLKPYNYIDLTPPLWIEKGIYVIKAVGGGTLDLYFGEGHPQLTGDPNSIVKVHPIC